MEGGHQFEGVEATVETTKPAESRVEGGSMPMLPGFRSRTKSRHPRSPSEYLFRT